jgi:hypothetical protein
MAARDVEPWSEIAFQTTGQGQRVSRAWCRSRDVDSTQMDLEARFGGLVYFRALAFTPGAEVVRRPAYKAESVLRTTSRPAPLWPAPGVVATPATAHPGLWQAPDG